MGEIQTVGLKLAKHVFTRHAYSAHFILTFHIASPRSLAPEMEGDKFYSCVSLGLRSVFKR